MTLTQRLSLVARGALIVPFFSWLAVILGVLVIYVLTASAPTLGDTTWQDATGFGSNLWLTSFGGQIPLGDGTLSLMPMTITLSYMYATYRVYRKRGIATWLEVALVSVLQVLFVTLIGIFAGEGSAWWYASVGIGAISSGLAIFAGREFLFHGQDWYELALQSWPRNRLLFRAMTMIAVLFAVVTFVSGFSRVAEIHGYYLTPVSGSIGLVLLQILYLPNWLIWGLAWILGPGFAVGSGTNFSSLGAESGPLPAIPILGAIPNVNVQVPWIIAVLVVMFLVLGIVHATRNNGDKSRRDVAIVDLISGAVVSLTVSAMSIAASGGIGQGRMEQLGVVPAQMLLATALVVVAPFMIGHFVGHPRSRAKVKAAMDSRQEEEGER